MRGFSGKRLAWGITGSAVLVASTAGLTLAATAPSAPAATSAVVATSSRGIAGSGTAVAAGLASGAIGAVSQGSSAPAAAPVWWGSAGGPLGVTATGQAAVTGTGAAARASAIAKAASDAASQARAAAQGAGISLGRIINLDVSVPGYPYPIPLGAAARGSVPAGTGVTPGAAGAATSGVPVSDCPVTGAKCAYPFASTYATVTITWAIG